MRLRDSLDFPKATQQVVSLPVHPLLFSYVEAASPPAPRPGPPLGPVRASEPD